MKIRGIIGLCPATVLFLTVVMFNRCSDRPTVPLPQTVDFNFHVRPILVKNCYLCHGPDSSSREADLRLDTFEGATAEREEGIFAIQPGRPQKSEMIARINSDDPEQLMPPPASNLSLTERDKAILEKWIDQGAEWKPHWAFIPPTKPEVPPTKEKADNEVDAFILAKLEENQLVPAPLASKNTLIRRLSYVLTGLPPHPKDIESYINDTSPDAYEKLVDNYLNSPHFGERWARHWMDLARYAETRGHEFDYPVIGAWQYRDYLIRAFNEDVPYPQLVKEQLAGDLLDEPRWNRKTGQNESQLGTLFYTMTEGKHSPVDLVIDESERVDNMIDVTTKTFQALTVACSRCHDHKFDPIPTTDYYALYGIMKSSRFGVKDANFTLEEAENLAELNEIKSKIRQLTAQAWLEQAPLPVQTTSAYEPQSTDVDLGYEVLGDFRNGDLSGWQTNGIAFGNQTTLGEPRFDLRTQQLTQLSSGRASSQKINSQVVGSLRSPNFTITQDFINVRARGKKSIIRVVIDNFQLIQNPIYGELEMRVDTSGWQDYTVDLSPWKGHTAYLEVIPGYFDRHRYRLPADAYVEVTYAQAYTGDVPPPPSLEEVTTDLSAAVNRWVNKESSASDIQYLNRYLRQNPVDVSSFSIAGLLQQQTKLAQSFTDTAYFTGLTEGFRINSPVFIRGNPKTLTTEKVPHRFLSSLSDEESIFDSPGSNRAALAEAIVAPDNPLTSRVMVNRIWHQLFGRGIVETVDNFGLQGKLPTHPALLDFLAIEFQESGGSIKDMVKYIVLSNTFRRAVVTDSLVSARDPENLFLSGYPLRRLEAEAIRDGMLAVAGQLDSTMFGPSVPIHLTEFMQGRGRPKESGPLDGNGRRSIYLEVRRNFLSPMMLTFDRPIPFSTFGKRNTTNVPAQSLMLMNDPMVLEQAKHLAQRVVAKTELSVDERIQQIYQWAFARPARPEEVSQATAFLQQQAKVHQAQDILTSEEVWQDYCHTIFNTKEFIYLI